METSENVMTGEESLKIISEMINKTKVNIRQGIFHLLFWGWLIFLCSLSVYILFRYRYAKSVADMAFNYTRSIRLIYLRICEG